MNKTKTLNSVKGTKEAVSKPKGKSSITALNEDFTMINPPKPPKKK